MASLAPSRLPKPTPVVRPRDKGPLLVATTGFTLHTPADKYSQHLRPHPDQDEDEEEDVNEQDHDDDDFSSEDDLDDKHSTDDRRSCSPEEPVLLLHSAVLNPTSNSTALPLAFRKNTLSFTPIHPRHKDDHEDHEDIEDDMDDEDEESVDPYPPARSSVPRATSFRTHLADTAFGPFQAHTLNRLEVENAFLQNQNNSLCRDIQHCRQTVQALKQMVAQRDDAMAKMKQEYRQACLKTRFMESIMADQQSLGPGSGFSGVNQQSWMRSSEGQGNGGYNMLALSSSSSGTASQEQILSSMLLGGYDMDQESMSDEDHDEDDEDDDDEVEEDHVEDSEDEELFDQEKGGERKVVTDEVDDSGVHGESIADPATEEMIRMAEALSHGFKDSVKSSVDLLRIHTGGPSGSSSFYQQPNLSRDSSSLSLSGEDSPEPRQSLRRRPPMPMNPSVIVSAASLRSPSSLDRLRASPTSTPNQEETAKVSMVRSGSSSSGESLQEVSTSKIGQQAIGRTFRDSGHFPTEIFQIEPEVNLSSEKAGDLSTDDAVVATVNESCTPVNLLLMAQPNRSNTSIVATLEGEDDVYSAGNDSEQEDQHDSPSESLIVQEVDGHSFTSSVSKDTTKNAMDPEKETEMSTASTLETLSSPTLLKAACTSYFGRDKESVPPLQEPDSTSPPPGDSPRRSWISPTSGRLGATKDGSPASFTSTLSTSSPTLPSPSSLNLLSRLWQGLGKLSMSNSSSGTHGGGSGGSNRLSKDKSTSLTSSLTSPSQSSKATPGVRVTRLGIRRIGSRSRSRSLLLSPSTVSVTVAGGVAMTNDSPILFQVPSSPPVPVMNLESKRAVSLSN